MNDTYVLITGSSRGLGKALALVFACHQYNIILHGRDNSELKKVKKEVEQTGVNCSMIQGELTKETTIHSLHTIAKEKNISILINNAGVHCPHLPLENITDEHIDELLYTNLIALIKLTKRVYSDFIEKQEGTIININSLSGLKSHYLRTIYCASKWGLKGFSDALRLEAQKHNIRIIDIYPGRIMTKKEFDVGMSPEDVAKKIYDGFINLETTTIELFKEIT